MNRQNIAIVISVVALVLSSIGLRISYKNQEYDRLVAYEQKKQETRLLLVETDLLFEKLEEEYLELKRTNTIPETIEGITKIYNDIKVNRQLMASGASIFETLPTSDKTDARLDLEIMFATEQKINRQIVKSLRIARETRGKAESIKKKTEMIEKMELVE